MKKAVIWSVLASGLMAQSSARAESWTEIRTRYFNIYHRPEANLAYIERKLRARALAPGASREEGGVVDAGEKIALRVDALFDRARSLLDMYPQWSTESIKIFRDRYALGHEYESIFGVAKEEVSFYVHRYATIYTNEKDISDSVMVHEMAHAVVDRYFLIKPPEKIKEMLSQYVDIHLDRDPG